MQRLLYVITQADTGGAQNHVFELLKGFRSGYQVALAVGSEGSLTERARNLNIPVYVIPSLKRQINPLNDLKAIQQLHHIINTFGPDLIHAHSTKAGLIARIAGKLANVPVIFTAHGWVFAPGVPLLTRLLVWLMEAFSAPLSARIICVSNYDQVLAKRWLPVQEKQLAVIPYGIPPLMSQAEPTQNPPKILMAARFQQQKDQPMLIRSLAKLPNPKLKVLFAGDGPLFEQSKQLAKNLKVDHLIEFLGNRNDVEHILSESQIFILFSKYEGLPISIMEAMRAGLPVVATDVCGVKEEVIDGETGYLVPRGNDSYAATVIQRLIDNPDLRGQMGKKGWQKFQREFTDIVMLDNIERVYKELLSHVFVTKPNVNQ